MVNKSAFTNRKLIAIYSFIFLVIYLSFILLDSHSVLKA